MLEKIFVLFVMFVLILAYDVPRLKLKQKRERLAYGGLMLIALYFSVDYVSNIDMPKLHMVVTLLLSDTAEQIFGYLKAGVS
ncbi:hypothetical protein L1N85_09365 [Paenibacillus alkaliterrae]|uniref:hypothetical protein n=1 Tax=Paenibacillus alkaliterrae TaxID=320909 RepID=UPI001F32E65F|nr:hypothetical protein [Paenibacillus alkaliterrae]MCF2938645.1 hypothetical protein [Paenibacillus alkaliterrae]